MTVLTIDHREVIPSDLSVSVSVSECILQAGIITAGKNSTTNVIDVAQLLRYERSAMAIDLLNADFP